MFSSFTTFFIRFNCCMVQSYFFRTLLYRLIHKELLSIEMCQRHHGPEGRVLITNVTSGGHIVSSYTKLDRTLCSGSEQKFNFMTKLQLPKLHQTVLNPFLNINISNSNNLNKFELASPKARVTPIKFTKWESVS